MTIRTVLHIFRSPVGGLFRHVLDLARAQAEAGVAVGMAFDAAPAEGRLRAAVAELDGICAAGLLRLPIARAPAPGDVANIARIAAHYRADRPDIIHGHGAKGGFYARILSRLIGAPAVYTLHGGVLHYTMREPSGALYLMTERLMLGMTDGILFDSQFSQNEFAAKVGRPRCLTGIVGNGLLERDFRLDGGGSAERREFDFIYLGELRRLKGVDVLLQAAALLRRRGRSFRLALFGGGPDEAAFRRLAAELGIDDDVVWCGPVPDPRQALERGRCIVVPSRRESFPYIVLEAAGYGLPMIATNVGAIPEIVGPEGDRLLVPPADPERLAQRMTAFLDEAAAAVPDPAALQRRVYQNYRVEAMSRQIMRFYAEVGSRFAAVRRPRAT